MTPNGRRAWRKWCKRARLRMNPHHRALYRGAIMRKKQPERTPLPPKPFTARSLVGMSEASKKRLREAIFCGSRAPEFASGAVSITAALRIGERLRPCPGCCSVRYRRYTCGTCGVRGVRLWRPYGNFYRPSDNLCTACAPPLTNEGRPPWYVPLVIGPQGQIWGFGARPSKDMDIWDLLPVSRGACLLCDGSGVLPARRSK